MRLIVPAFVFLASGTVLLCLVIDRVTAWVRRTDHDAPWHLLGLALGGALAIVVRLSPWRS